MKTLRLILGDQLNHAHSWYDTIDDDIVYFIAEMRQETDYVMHHIQKVVAFFESMGNFASHLKSKGHNVIYYQLDDPDNAQDLIKNITALLAKNGATTFEYQLPDEYRLDQQLKDFAGNSNEITVNVADTEHFLTTRDDLTQFFKNKKNVLMEYFYREMRKKYDIMMITAKDPEGGKWNFDKSNRNSWEGDTLIPLEISEDIDVSQTIARIERAGIKTFGNINVKHFAWPTTRAQSLEYLDYFCEHLLEYFGTYQDAMHTDQAFLYHSRLSFAMNSKMLHPKEVIDASITYWRENDERIDISQVEGFVRQILGWREFMRGIYWREMPAYATKNKLDNTNKLPDFFWTGKTKMNCLKSAITQSLDNAYAHHIQRLMITGNYALLTQVHPDDVDAWYLGIYIDAIEWVEITNTRGMSQFADGGLVASKPYVSSGNYINKMSNYCKGCTYNVKEKVGEKACPFNSLYWNFLDDKRAYFKDNHRMKMMYALLNKKSAAEIADIKDRAAQVIANPDFF